jgi:hypothetical protein
LQKEIMRAADHTEKATCLLCARGGAGNGRAESVPVTDENHLFHAAGQRGVDQSPVQQPAVYITLQ